MANVSIESVSDAVGCIYEAAYDQERWLDAVTGVCDLLGGSRACIVRVCADTLDAISTDPDPNFMSAEAIAVQLNDPLAAAEAALPVGMVHRRAEIAGPGFFRRELWQDWFRPRDMYDGLATNLLSSNDSYWLFDVHRGARQPAFDDTDIQLMQKIIPHMLRAGEIGRNFEKTSALASAFSHLPFGIMLVDGHQRVGHMNEAAEAMLARPDSPLRLKSGLVAAANPKDALELQRLVADACSLPDGALPGAGGTLVIPSGRQEHGSTRRVLSIAPFLNARAYSLSSQRCAIIMIRDVAASVSDGFEEHIGIVFDLTRSEARVAAALAAGRALKSAAVDNGVTFSTARTYLDRIYRKTGTNQQSQLVALLKSVGPLKP